MSHACIAHAEDWLDDMPPVERVALAAYRDGAMTQDAHATHIATILILLRQAMSYRAATEPDMSAQRRAKLQMLDATYQRVELAIGEGLGKRLGGLSAAQLQQYYESRRHEQCAPAACVDYWLRSQLEWWGAAKLRDQVLPMLMPCKRAQELTALVAQHAMAAPLVPETPALTRALTDTAKAAGNSMPAKPCDPSIGSDVDGDGLCFDWEARLGDPKLMATVTSSCPCAGRDQGNVPCDSHRVYQKTKAYSPRIDDTQVRVETGMRWTNPVAPACKDANVVVQANLDDGIAITVKNCKMNPRVVQFIQREKKLREGGLEPGQYERSTGCETKPQMLDLSDDRGPAWQQDGTPYYNSYRMDCDPKKADSMTIFDAPNFKEKEFDPKKYLYWRATFVSFVLCNGDVVRQIHWSRTLEVNASGKLEKNYSVEKNVMPDAKDVEMFQCLSKQQWASCSATRQGLACRQE
jgi:hypothetical protein